MVEAGYALDRLGWYAEADRFYKSALEWEPNYSYLLVYYGLHFLSMGDLHSARECYLQARKFEESKVIDEALDEIDGKLKHSNSNKEKFLLDGASEEANPSGFPVLKSA